MAGAYASPKRRSEAGLILLACSAFGAIPLLGAVDPFAGLALLGVFGVLATLRALLRNAPMLILMAVLVGLSFLFPILSPVPILLGIWFFIKRIAFFFEHLRVIILGLAVYAAGATLAISWGGSIGANAISFRRYPYCRTSFRFDGGLRNGRSYAGPALILTRIAGYSVRASLEIMSLVPVILVSLTLPFLKIAFDFVPDVVPEAIPDALPEPHVPSFNVPVTLGDHGLPPALDAVPAHPHVPVLSVPAAHSEAAVAYGVNVARIHDFASGPAGSWVRSL